MRARHADRRKPRLTGIPYILHQAWKSKTALPPHYAFWSRSFIECTLQLEPRLYDDADNRVLLADTFLERHALGVERARLAYGSLRVLPGKRQANASRKVWP